MVGYGNDHAYLWTAEQGMTFLPGIDDKSSIIAYNINNLGQITGYIGGPLTPVRWDGANSVTDLTNLPGWTSSSVEGTDSGAMPINDSALIACRVWVTDQGWCGALFNGIGWTFLGSLTPGGKDSSPTFINNKGEVVEPPPRCPAVENYMGSTI